MAEKDPATTRQPARAGKLAEPINWLRKEVDRVFDDLVRQPDRLFDFGFGNPRLPNFPLVEIKDKDDAYRINADVPGFQPDRISVSVADGVLVIKGEADDSSRSEEDGVVVEERHRGSFERRIPLPGAVADDGVKARLKNGVLKISVPKAKAPSARAVPIETGDG
ncbi:molecular chaperone Hsp20 [Sphingobium jiangsuense]|uniref:HSP20 family protein n=1 Tax=Sphingobium jiangsuense TaxID=870476 RepID=A0A7W6BPS9_9SPHN|nr:Hsp20/alpha crystallin family protein [Sphingobium jiangsuense]MBB3925629.1 HSP20 family protein [Sphingobium jiangsuense]GLT01636.1 molecular chaperone Hsp20 [Sphingobium jiangsuense]